MSKEIEGIATKPVFVIRDGQIVETTRKELTLNDEERRGNHYECLRAYTQEGDVYPLHGEPNAAMNKVGYGISESGATAIVSTEHDAGWLVFEKVLIRNQKHGDYYGYSPTYHYELPASEAEAWDVWTDDHTENLQRDDSETFWETEDEAQSEIDEQEHLAGDEDHEDWER